MQVSGVQVMFLCLAGRPVKGSAGPEANSTLRVHLQHRLPAVTGPAKAALLGFLTLAARLDQSGAANCRARLAGCCCCCCRLCRLAAGAALPEAPACCCCCCSSSASASSCHAGLRRTRSPPAPERKAARRPSKPFGLTEPQHKMTMTSTLPAGVGSAPSSYRTQPTKP